MTQVSDPGKGSSPLTRGTLAAASISRLLVGLIPAHAGNTFSCRSDSSREWAHPRSRGEHVHAISIALHPAGSSPLTRGTLFDKSSVVVHLRLIPAHAGNTTKSPGRPFARPAHPRSRGEHDIEPISEDLSYGSPPLAQGTRPLLTTIRVL